MKNSHFSQTIVRLGGWLGSSLLLATMLSQILVGVLPVKAEPTAADFGYGFNVAAWDISRLQAMEFNWMKVFNPHGSRLPVNVLLRVEADAGHLANLSAFENSMTSLAHSQKGFVDAYEIGNEPNLDASYGWTVAPNAADYATLLCAAYGRIKAADPDAIVVSAGLAPTGRVTGNWNGHPGHNGLYQDEREFLKEFLAAGGGNCLDAVGYHPYGFSADFDAEPDVNLGTPTTNCTNGFCFRGVEKIYAIMQSNGFGHKTIWATEYGWIVTPPSQCLSDPSWSGRLWQIVSEQKQADNLVGSFQYATANWPWMEAMFVFNLNFNQAGYPTCEQMRYYAVQDRPAETALSDMSKVTPVGELQVAPASVAAMITPDQQPFSQSTPIQLSNVGTAVLTYTASLDSGNLAPTIINPGSLLEVSESAEMTVTMTSNGRPMGVYTASLTIEATPPETEGVPVVVPITLFVVDEIFYSYLPLVERP